MTPNKTVLSLLIVAMTIPSLASAAPRKAQPAGNSGASGSSNSKSHESSEEGDEGGKPAPRSSSAPSRPSAPAPTYSAPSRPSAPAPRPVVVEQRHEEARPAPRPAPAPAPVVEQKREEKRAEPVVEKRQEEKRPAPVVEQKHEEKRPEPVVEKRQEEKRPAPVVEQKHEEKRPEPVVEKRQEEKRPAPVVEQKHEEKRPENRPAPSRAVIPPKPSEPARARVETTRTKGGNVVTQAQKTHIEESHKREQTVMRGNTRVNTIVTVHVNSYRNEQRPIVVNRYNVYQQTYYPRYHDAYRPWYNYGFRGGFYYPFTPVYDIQESFYNPIIFWMYADQYDETYYNTWYGSDMYSYRELQTRNARPGVFFPTQTIRDLGLGVSTMPIGQQANFRSGMNKLADQLEWKLREGLDSSIMLGRSDIVISHYETLNDALVIEGFVSADARQFPFKALFDLNNSDMNMVFTPASFDGAPSDEQLADLRELNERIAYYGGAVIMDSTDVEVLPAPMPIDPTPTPVIIVDETPTPAPVIVYEQPRPHVIVVAPRGRRGD